MAEIKPFKAWRYNSRLAADIENLTSPLFDVVSGKQRESLYQNPLNSIHLSVPKPPDPDQRAADVLNQWKRDGTLLQDSLPGIYVYYQYFRLPGVKNELCRKGFICNIRTYDWDENIILRHENTMPNAVNDRISLLAKTEFHASATHGLYTDDSYALESFMDEAIQNPIYEVEDYQGVRDVLAVIHDRKVIQLFIETIATKKIILADGHHRYEGSLAYKHRQMASNPEHTGREGYNFHLMYLTNTNAGDFRILPTHRLIHGIQHFDEHELLQKLAHDFIIKPLDDADTVNEIIMGKPWAFGLLFKDRAFKIRLKPEVINTNPWKFPPLINALDLTVMHYFIIEKALGIKGKDQRASDKISFDRSFTDCLKKVLQEEAQLAIITNEVSIEDVKTVCESGYTMPQKSTYFYPKVICGFVFSSIKEDEFQTPAYSGF